MKRYAQYNENASSNVYRRGVFSHKAAIALEETTSQIYWAIIKNEFFAAFTLLMR